MKRSRHKGGLSTLRLVALAALVIVGASVVAADAADIKPRRIIRDRDPNFNTLWVDTVNNEILVGNDAQESLQVYSRTANGLVAPLREIKSPPATDTTVPHNTFVTFPGQVIIDPVNNEILSVGNDIADLITTYTRTADGNVAPIRRINGRLQTAGRFNRSWGLALDTVNDEIAVTHQKRNRISIFARTANSDTNPATAPKRTVSGSRTGLADPHGVFIDTTVNEIYVVNSGEAAPANAAGTRDGVNGAPSITVYARTASGNVTPKRTIQGNLTQLDHARPLFVDSGRHEIVVANGSPTDAILFFDQNANGNVAPVRVLQGARTGLSNPTGVFVDAVNNELLVANWGNHTITVYPRGAGGDIKPTRVISPTKSRVAAGIGNPGAIYIDPERDEIGVVN
jgi:NHL repeat-containing protein